MHDEEITPTAASRSINILCASISSVRNRYSHTSNRTTEARNIMEYFVFIKNKKKGLHPAALYPNPTANGSLPT